MHTVNCAKTLKHKENKFLIVSMLIFSPLYHVPSLITTPLNFICWHKIIAPYNFSAAAPTHCSQTLRWRSWSLLADAWHAEYSWHWLAPLTATHFKLLLLMTGLLFPLQGITRNLDNQLLNMGHLHLSSYNLSTLSNRNEEKCTKFMQVHTVCLQFKCPLVKPHLD